MSETEGAKKFRIKMGILYKGDKVWARVPEGREPSGTYRGLVTIIDIGDDIVLVRKPYQPPEIDLWILKSDIWY